MVRISLKDIDIDILCPRIVTVMCTPRMARFFDPWLMLYILEDIDIANYQLLIMEIFIVFYNTYISLIPSYYTLTIVLNVSCCQIAFSYAISFVSLPLFLSSLSMPLHYLSIPFCLQWSFSKFYFTYCLIFLSP